MYKHGAPAVEKGDIEANGAPNNLFLMSGDTKLWLLIVHELLAGGNAYNNC